jgi:hypothetical protein
MQSLSYSSVYKFVDQSSQMVAAPAATQAGTESGSFDGCHPIYQMPCQKLARTISLCICSKLNILG